MMLNQTPEADLVDPRNRPYFLWDIDMTLSEFRRALCSQDPITRAYLVAKLMRQAKPDDVFLFVSRTEIREQWSLLEAHLGRKVDFWRWLLGKWDRNGADS